MQSKSNLLNFFIKSNPFQPGREVFFNTPDGKETTGHIAALRISETDGKLSLSYDVLSKSGVLHENLPADQVFDTKKELRMKSKPKADE